jgi:D-alanyl-lipoteichoic acid acyltransferase DltB (MBOAT superfamily)
MLFNSLQFIAFFPIVVIVYWMLPSSGRWRNIFLLLASYYFYMNWMPIYALLILLSSVTTWGCAMMMSHRERKSDKRPPLTLCLLLNFLILFIFKYAGFFNESVRDILAYFNIAIDIPELNILLPVGISFYTFQAVGYTIDVYRGTIKAERNLLTYMLFVSFFPQLVAGPIERAKNLLPQFHEKHVFSETQFIAGLKLMIWGYFLKLCVAQNLSPYVDAVFNNLPFHNGNSVLLASIFFTFQIFSDFGGYSLIAIGVARCMGFTLMQNFRQPYLATSIREFWRRWHISLSTWFADYLYIPLGGSRCSVARHQRNLFVTFLVSGLWHGANWTFVVWGAYHGVLMVVQSLFTKFVKIPSNRILTVIEIVGTFILAALGWIFFRANTISDAILALKKIAFERGMLYNGDGKPAIFMGIMMIMLLMAKEIIDRYQIKLPVLGKPTLTTDIVKSTIVLLIIITCASFNSGQFIYFQF